ncbi:MAG TPA: hypothetical protein V6D50_00025 [Chroococcales cyanobacterium]
MTVIASGMAETPSIASTQVCVFNNVTNQVASLLDYQFSPIADLRTHCTNRSRSSATEQRQHLRPSSI